MLQVARLAPRLLDDATDNVRTFLTGLAGPEGFLGRDGEPDLYYTVFGLDSLAALEGADGASTAGGGGEVRGGSIPDLEPWLAGFGGGDSLDLVHLVCLARARTATGLVDQGLDTMTDRLLGLRRDDGGWAMTDGDEASTSYGTFLAVAALQDLGIPIGRPADAVAFLEGMALPSGGYALDARTPVATTPTTAAAVVALRQLGGRAPAKAGDYLLGNYHRQGGFLAADGAPMPDLLSTAVALHALSVLDASPDRLREPLLDFVDSLWTSRGGFYGQWADDVVDVEYTYYGLLALGHLAVMA
ncbi:MAG: prenyltransferase/squalene oxidase repeat-containing protein [Acidobacteriota bacterium]